MIPTAVSKAHQFTYKTMQITLKKYPFYRRVGIRNISDYSPFGVLLKERTVETAHFRRGFQGQDIDDEVKGKGNSVNFKYRMHDPRVGRFFAVDLLDSKYPFNSPYAFSENRVIDATELEGLEVSFSKQMKANMGECMLTSVESNSIYKSIYSRYIAGNDIIYIRANSLDEGTNAVTYIDRGAPNNVNGYVMEIQAKNFVDNQFVGDETYLFRTILHEGIHARKNIRIDQDGMENYPGYVDAYQNSYYSDELPQGQLHHNQMANFNRPELVTGMREFDKSMGTEHSDDWYDAMSWVGLQGTLAWDNLKEEDRVKNQEIITNENKYMEYRTAVLKGARSTSNSSKKYYEKQALKISGTIDWDLFNQTRKGTENSLAPVENNENNENNGN